MRDGSRRISGIHGKIPEAFPSRTVERITRANRKIRLGVMGLADLPAQLEIPSASQAGRDLADRLLGFIHRTAREASGELAGQRGCFPNWEQSVYGTGSGPDLPLRHATLTTIAPTGVISTLADCRGGIEPSLRRPGPGGSWMDWN